MLYDDVSGAGKDRRTVCISTQAGCAMGCVFCATGQAGLARNLTAGEIVAQVLAAARWLAKSETTNQRISESTTDHKPSAIGLRPFATGQLTNIVVMGMGEPLANYDRVWQALRTITDPDAFGLGARHITLSTVGLPQGIRKMAGESLQVNLAVSLHAPNDALRSTLLPINLRFPIREVMAAIQEYIAATNRRVTFEYALMDGLNDTAALARELVALLKPLRSPTGGAMCHVNLIPLNPVAESPYQPSTPEHAAAFRALLEQSGIPATLRMRRGIDIDAGCGQLRRRVTQVEGGSGVKVEVEPEP
jgi:23S rRNA (adenine2503-C2)-methyltransferase